MNFLAACQMSDRWEEPFKGCARFDYRALWWDASAPTKGRPPFRKEMPETFSSDGVLEFKHDRAAAHVA
jgi:hypothetical protein